MRRKRGGGPLDLAPDAPTRAQGVDARNPQPLPPVTPRPEGVRVRPLTPEVREFLRTMARIAADHYWMKAARMAGTDPVPEEAHSNRATPTIGDEAAGAASADPHSSRSGGRTVSSAAGRSARHPRLSEGDAGTAPPFRVSRVSGGTHHGPDDRHRRADAVLIPKT